MAEEPGGAPPPDAPASRGLPQVLRDALERDDALVLVVGAFGAAIAGTDPQFGSHANVDIGGAVIRVPTLAGNVGASGTPAYVVATKDQVLALGTVSSDGGGGMPVGAMAPFGGSTAPAGFLLCDGASYAVATYPALHAVIGYTYGGSGANFNVPDLIRRAPYGAGGGSSAGQSDGRATGSRGPAHYHTFSGSGSASGSTSSDGSHNHGSAGDHDHGPAGGGGFAKNQGQTAQGATGTAWTRYNVVDYTSGTDTDGAHTHSDAGSHSHSFSAGVSIGGNTSGGGGQDSPGYLYTAYIIRAQ